MSHSTPNLMNSLTYKRNKKPVFLLVSTLLRRVCSFCCWIRTTFTVIVLKHMEALGTTMYTTCLVPSVYKCAPSLQVKEANVRATRKRARQLAESSAATKNNSHSANTKHSSNVLEKKQKNKPVISCQEKHFMKSVMHTQ